jgi:hypothetical protein
MKPAQCSCGEEAVVTFVPGPSGTELHNYYNPPAPRLLGWNQINSKLQPREKNTSEFFQA